MSGASARLRDLSEEAVWHLEAACCRFEEAWQAKARPVPWDFLNGADGPERPALLRELLRLDVYYRRRAGESPSAQDYPVAAPEDRTVLCEVLEEKAEPCETLIEAPAGLPRTELPPDPSVPLGGRYQLLRFHARGGLGEVHVALDTELSREVAVKQMQAGCAADPDSRLRFVLEGEVTGGLEHPGVVPVYGRGTQPDGRPFYTMRFIRGETLAEAVGRFHAPGAARFDSLEFRQLLGRFVAVCQAVAYAHSRGVLHRDLKPANVMLGPFGETLVLDWGLAKILGRTGSPGHPEAGGLLPARGANGVATLGVVGTPAYMSPEQAAGRAEELGPATDVYGLGATLYEMLTGRAPFQGSLFDMLTQAAAGAWRPPGQVNRAVPPALDAVCRQAMATRPQDRYGTALELAKDLERWLADEPVAAYPEPWRPRLRRWARKHPGRVSGAVVLLAAGVIGLTLGTVLLERSKREAEASYQIARQGVNHFLHEVSEDVLLDEPGMQPLRQTLLNEALNYHEGFLKIRPDDLGARQELAETYRLRGALDGEVGRVPEGKACLARAVGLYEGLLALKPADKGLRFGLARCRVCLAELEVKSGEAEAGRETASRALAMLLALQAEEPQRMLILHQLGIGLDLRAQALALQGDLASALRDNGEALAMAEKPRPPSLSEGVLGLETAADFVGGSRVNAVQRSTPVAFGSTANRMGLSGRFVAETPILRVVARAHGNRGAILATAGRTAESCRAFQDSAGLYARLAEGHPRSGRFRQGLAVALLGSGRAEVELGRPSAGERDLRKALALLERLCDQDPLVVDYAGSLLQARGLLGECLTTAGRNQGAARLLRDAVHQGEQFLREKDRQHPLAADHPRFLRALERLEADFREPENVEWPDGKGEPAADAQIRRQQQHLRDREEAARREATSPSRRCDVSTSAVALAGLLLKAGRSREALEVVERALPAHEELLREEERRSKPARGEEKRGLIVPNLLRSYGIQPRPPVPPSHTFRALGAALLVHRGAALAALGQTEPARDAVARAVRVSEALARGKSPVPCPPWSWPSAWSVVAGELLREAAEPCYLLDLARHLALASTLPGSNNPDPADQALQALRDLLASGFDDVHKLRNDRRLAPLRGRRDFQELLARLPPQTPDQAPASRER